MLPRNRILLFACLALNCGGDDGDPAGPPVPPGALRYAELSAGYFHTCGLALDGRAYCWGGNEFGTLGDGTRTTRTVPTRVATIRTFAHLDAGAGHSCAITAEGAAWCWGHNDEGQLGDGTFTGRDQPVAVTGGHAFTSVSAGHAHSCGLTTNGIAYCWGDDTRGQLGNGTSETGATRSAVPVRVASDLPFTQVVAGYYQTCGIVAGGAAYCWGGGESGQNGDGTQSDRHSPAVVAGDRLFTAVAPGDRFACGVSAGSIWCWGANRVGELAVASGGSAVPVALHAASSVSAVVTSAGTSTISSAEAYGCALRPDSSAFCWGGAVRALRVRSPEPAPLDGAIRIRTIAPGAEHVCALNRDQHAFCGGANYSGQLGDGTRVDRAALAAVAAPLP